MKLFIVAIALLCAGCTAQEAPIKQQEDGESPKWISVGSVFVGRIHDPQTGATCYVTNAGAISCVLSAPEK